MVLPIGRSNNFEKQGNYHISIFKKQRTTVMKEIKMCETADLFKILSRTAMKVL
jgi:hypothetical protein